MKNANAPLMANPIEARKSLPPFPDNFRKRMGSPEKLDVRRPLTIEERLALPDEDSSDIAHRFAAFEEEVRPRGEIGRFFARRAAVLSLRLDRCVRHEAAMTSKRVRDASAAFEEERQAYIEKMADAIAADPATHTRRLRTMPEGIAWMISTWQAVQADLTHPTRDAWSCTHRQRVINLMGRRSGDFPTLPVAPLCKAGWGDFSDLTGAQGGDLDPQARQRWAREQVSLLIDAEVAALEQLLVEFDDEPLIRDREEAAARALFAATPEATLARKYEAATERGLYLALRELRENRGEDPVGAEIEPPSVPVSESAQAAQPAAERGSLGSFFPASAFQTSSLSDGPGDLSGWVPPQGDRPTAPSAPAPGYPHQR